MRAHHALEVASAEVVLGTRVLDEDLQFFRGLGFELESIFPADAVVLPRGRGFELSCETETEWLDFPWPG